RAYRDVRSADEGYAGDPRQQRPDQVRRGSEEGTGEEEKVSLQFRGGNQMSPPRPHDPLFFTPSHRSTDSVPRSALRATQSVQFVPTASNSAAPSTARTRCAIGRRIETRPRMRYLCRDLHQPHSRNPGPDSLLLLERVPRQV